MNHKNLSRNTRKRLALKKGQTLVEYALVLTFISVVAIAALLSTGGEVKSTFTTIDSQLSMASTGGTTPTSSSPPPRN